MSGYKTELVAIYKLQFYRKQKHWKLVGDARRRKDQQSEAQTKGKSEDKKKGCSLDKTYDVERPDAEQQSVLNQAFVEDGKDSNISPPPNTPVVEQAQSWPDEEWCPQSVPESSEAVDTEETELTWQPDVPVESEPAVCDSDNVPSLPAWYSDWQSPPDGRWGGAGGDEWDGAGGGELAGAVPADTLVQDAAAEWWRFVGSGEGRAEWEGVGGCEGEEEEAEGEEDEEEWWRGAHCNPHSTEVDISVHTECGTVTGAVGGGGGGVTDVAGGGLWRWPTAALRRRAAALSAAQQLLHTELARREYIAQQVQQRALRACGGEEPTRDVGLRWEPVLASSLPPHHTHPPPPSFTRLAATFPRSPPPEGPLALALGLGRRSPAPLLIPVGRGRGRLHRERDDADNRGPGRC